MASTLLLPDPAVLALVSVEVHEEVKMITATARTMAREVPCPVCGHLAWYGEGKVTPQIDRAFPFAQAPAAHQYLHDRKAIGKVLLEP